MSAIILRKCEPSDVLVPEAVPAPVAAKKEDIINVESSNMTCVKTQVRAGRSPQAWMPHPKLEEFLKEGNKYNNF
jgi:hypothetical protein